MHKKLIGTLFFAVALTMLAAGALAAQGGASIKFVKPGDRRNVPIGQMDVTVAITGVTLSEGYTWQLLVDSVPEGSVRDRTTITFEMSQPSGPRRMKAVLLDPQGQPVASDEILVLAAPVEELIPVFNRSWFAPAMAVLTVVVAAIIVLGLRLRPRTNGYQDSPP